MVRYYSKMRIAQCEVQLSYMVRDLVGHSEAGVIGVQQAGLMGK